MNIVHGRGDLMFLEHRYENGYNITLNTKICIPKKIGTGPTIINTGGKLSLSTNTKSLTGNGMSASAQKSTLSLNSLPMIFKSVLGSSISYVRDKFKI